MQAISFLGEITFCITDDGDNDDADILDEHEVAAVVELWTVGIDKLMFEAVVVDADTELSFRIIVWCWVDIGVTWCDCVGKICGIDEKFPVCENIWVGGGGRVCAKTAGSAVTEREDNPVVMVHDLGAAAPHAPFANPGTLMEFGIWEWFNEWAVEFVEWKLPAVVTVSKPGCDTQILIDPLLLCGVTERIDDIETHCGNVIFEANVTFVVAGDSRLCRFSKVRNCDASIFGGGTGAIGGRYGPWFMLLYGEYKG